MDPNADKKLNANKPRELVIQTSKKGKGQSSKSNKEKGKQKSKSQNIPKPETQGTRGGHHTNTNNELTKST